MRNSWKLLAILVWAAAVIYAVGSPAQVTENDDKTLSPYFLVTSEDADVDRFALESTSAKVNIAGVIADVIVTQVYKNHGKKPIEAIYIFPASTRAAVYAMKMTIGERTIVAKIEKREEARQQYEQAKEEGRSASLLEQQRPNVFQMNVANILPGDRIEVEMKYTELLIPTDGIYDFVYPTVVGPRYSNQPEASAPASEKWVANPYLHEGEAAPYGFDIKVNLAAGLPIQKVTCGTHKTNISYDGKTVAEVELDRSEKDAGNRDFILKYQLAGGKIDSGLLLYEGEKENFFLLMMQPPKRVTIKDIPPREYIFIVDVSGSMHGFPLDISKELLKDLIGNLRPTDTFNVLLFAGGSKVMSERSIPATDANVRRAIDVIDRQQGGGGTELLPALKRALALPRNDSNVSRTVVIATDGYVSVEKEAFDLIRENLGEANMFTFGIGSSVNRFLLEGMARVGLGEPLVLTSPDQAKSKADEFRKLIQSPVLTDIEIDYGRFDVYDVEPPSIPDVLAERPVVVFGKWKGKPAGEIGLKGFTGSRTYKERVDVYESKPLSANSALRYLWARRRIAVLDDYNNLSRDDERVKEVTSLGLTYNLLTAYTSFVAIDSEIRLKDGKAVTIKQPLPLPQGVSDYAVGYGGKSRLAKSSAKVKPMMMYAPSPPTSAAGWGGNMAEEAEDLVSAPEVEIDKITVTGALDKKAIKKLLDKNLGGLEICYINALSRSPGLSGDITLRLEIGPDGKVKSASLVSAAKDKKGLGECMIKKIKTLSFAAPADGKSATVTVTFNLNP
jgi:Ca-activated chloride channel family protein